MANAEILISNSAIIMTGMVMIMMTSGNGATALRVGATALAAVAMVMAGSCRKVRGHVTIDTSPRNIRHVSS